MNNCSKNGIKREGESCTLNNNCIYPNCMNISSAKEFFNKELSGEPLTEESVIEGLVEFAKLHCEAMKNAIVENAEVRVTENALIEEGSCYTTYDDGVISVTVDKDSIINAYPLEEKIK